MDTALPVLANRDHYAAMMVPDRLYEQYGFPALAIPPQEDRVYWAPCCPSGCGIDLEYRFEKSSPSSSDCMMAFD